MKQFKILFALSFVLMFCTMAYAQDKHQVFNSTDIKWVEAKPPLPPNTKIVVLEGDPSKEGLFTMRIMVPAGFKIPPHFHPGVEHVTVISGVFNIGAGDKFDDTKGSAVNAGGFVVIPVGHHHYAWANEETVIQLNGMGPWGLTYVNPEDDPANNK